MNFGEYYSKNSHTNQITGCVIWDGESTKSEPIAGGFKVRKTVFEAVNGPQPYRSKFFPICENPLCVKAEHIQVTIPEPAKHDYPQDKVDKAWEMYSKGLRQEHIAKEMDLNPSTVSKYLKHARALKETPSED